MALTETRRTSAAARPEAPRRERTSARATADRWSPTLLVAGALSAALAGLHVTLQGTSWWFIGSAYAVVVLVVAFLSRRLLRSWFWAPAVSLAAGIALLTLGYAADTALLGVIPTPATLERFGALIGSGVASIVEQRVPATPELGIVLLIAVLMVLCAWVCAVLLATPYRALVAFPLAAILAVPTVIKPELTDAFWFLVVAALYLVLLRVGAALDSRRIVFLTGAAMVIGSVVLPNALPAIDRDDAPRTGGFRAGINPFITLGDDLRRGDPTLAITYTTTAEDPVYLRLTTLETFTGDTWGPVVGEDRGTDLSSFPAPAGLDPSTPFTETSVEVKVADIVTRWLPTPYPVTSVSGVAGDWFWDPADLTVRSADSEARGQDYRVGFLEVNPTAAQLAASEIGAGVVDPELLQLPADMPPVIAQTAHEVADAAPSAYDKALALQTYLRSPPFRYSEEAPVDEGFDGSGMDALAVFLDRKVGYCVHYASAMAVMARELGIPSRIAVGFQPGKRSLVDGKTVFSVTTDDLHAWPELYFEGIGWLRFEPTPGRGVVPSYGTAAADDPATPQDESSTQPSALPSSSPGARPDVDDAPQTAEEVAARQSTSTLVSLAVLAGVLLLVMTPAGVRAGVRRRRIRRIREGRDAAAAAWDEVRDTARDIGWSAPESETPRDFVHRLGRELVSESTVLGDFRARVEVSAYGPPDATALSPADLAAVRRAILRSAAWGPRLRAFLLPPSLLRRWRPDAG